MKTWDLRKFFGLKPKREVKQEILGEITIQHGYIWTKQENMTEHKAVVYRNYYVDNNKTKKIFANSCGNSIHFDENYYDLTGKLVEK